MSFARLWTAALAGIALALPMTLCLVALASLFEGVAPFSRDGATPVFLGLWAAAILACAVPQRPLGQWLIAIWASVGLLAFTSLVYGFVAGAAAPSLATAIGAMTFALLARALKPTSGV